MPRRNSVKTISVIMPCLNEEETIEHCILSAKKGLKQLNKKYQSEILVIDNGSTDRSVILAKRAGARVIREQRKGYGNAYKTGISKSKSEYIILGDSDGTYNFSKILPFVKALESGADMVLGSRFKGKIAKGAMPWANRYIGNPILTGMLNIFFGSRISDAHTGMRALTRNAVKKLNLRSPGMEFASEMIVKAIYQKLSIREIPISYSPRKGVSKLSPLSDAWRHIKFMLLYAPTYALVAPGLLLFLSGFTVSSVLLVGKVTLGILTFDIHTMMVAILVTNLGLQILLLGIIARQYTQNSLGLVGGILGTMLIRIITAEKLLLYGFLLTMTGIISILGITATWAAEGFSTFAKFRETIYAVGISTSGTQLMFASLLYGLLQDQKNTHNA